MVARVAALLAILLLPAAQAADSGSLTFTTFASAHYQVQTTTDGDEAATARRDFDTAGTRDGTVTQADVEAFRVMFKDAFAKTVHDPRATENLKVDGTGPTHIALEQIEYFGAEGPVSSTAAINVTLRVTLTFQPLGNATHTLVMQTEARPNRTFAMSVTAPKGSVITSASGLAATGTTSSDKTSVAFMASSPTPQGSTLTFDGSGVPDAPKASTPMPGAVLTAVLVAALALVARRRAHG